MANSFTEVLKGIDEATGRLVGLHEEQIKRYNATITALRSVGEGDLLARDENNTYLHLPHILTLIQLSKSPHISPKLQPNHILNEILAIDAYLAIQTLSEENVYSPAFVANFIAAGGTITLSNSDTHENSSIAIEPEQTTSHRNGNLLLLKPNAETKLATKLATLQTSDDISAVTPRQHGESIERAGAANETSHSNNQYVVAPASPTPHTPSAYLAFKMHEQCVQLGKAALANLATIYQAVSGAFEALGDGLDDALKAFGEGLEQLGQLQNTFAMAPGLYFTH